MKTRCTRISEAMTLGAFTAGRRAAAQGVDEFGAHGVVDPRRRKPPQNGAVELSEPACPILTSGCGRRPFRRRETSLQAKGDVPSGEGRRPFRRRGAGNAPPAAQGQRRASARPQQAINVPVFPGQRALVIAELSLANRELGRVNQRAAADAHLRHHVVQELVKHDV